MLPQVTKSLMVGVLVLGQLGRPWSLVVLGVLVLVQKKERNRTVTIYIYPLYQSLLAYFIKAHSLSSRLKRITERKIEVCQNYRVDQ